MACLRDDRDLLARYGGEESAVVLPDISPDEAALVAQRLCQEVALLGLPHERRGDACRVVTISAGVASSRPGDPLRARVLLESADAVLYRAKRDGRNRHVVAGFAGPIDAPAPDRRTLQNA